MAAQHSALFLRLAPRWRCEMQCSLHLKGFVLRQVVEQHCPLLVQQSTADPSQSLHSVHGHTVCVLCSVREQSLFPFESIK